MWADMRFFGGLVFAIGIVAGCGGPDPYGPPLANQGATGNIGGNTGAGGTAAQPGTNQCGGGATLTPADPSTFPPCGSACTDSPNAHCVPSSLVPASVAAQLAKCTDGSSFCVPDSFIKSGGAAPPTCKSLNGAGVCLSVCVPQVKQYESILPQDVCAADERCAPCLNPLTNMSSGACEIGQSSGGTCSDGGMSSGTSDGGASGTPAPAACPYTGAPLLDVTTLPSCGMDAHCVSASLVPTKMQSQLAMCTAPNSGYCVPDKFSTTGGNFIPKTCTSLIGAEGRCLNVVIPQVASQESELPQDVCDADEKCVPCYSPMDGTTTGACALSCDPGPTKPAAEFQACCKEDNVEEGKCVPKTAIASTLQSNLDQDKCTDKTTLCVPTENLTTPFKPMACNGQGLIGGAYTGVCLSKCLHFGFFQSLGIGQGNCDDKHLCAPCTNPLTGQPTGAPGCPTS
jgi:hypothetical protein